MNIISLNVGVKDSKVCPFYIAKYFDGTYTLYAW